MLSLKRPLRDGRTELAFTPVDFWRRLATLIPPISVGFMASLGPTTISALPSFLKV